MTSGKASVRTAIVGGGAAGFFLAVNLKEMVPEMEITIFERSPRVLRKVEVSGGGRCNCTNTFHDIRDLSHAYPRGHRLLKRLFKTFDHRAAYEWFKRRGVPLVTQDDECVFPAAQDSRAIIHCFLSLARSLHIKIRCDVAINELSQLEAYDYIAVTTGGSPRAEGLRWLLPTGIQTVQPVPSLFTLSIADEPLRRLMGTVVPQATVMIPGTRMRASGTLLITHWGMSGPAILKLSSYAARLLHDHHYRLPLAVNWCNSTEQEIRATLQALADSHPQKQVTTLRPFHLPARLWEHLSAKAIGGKANARWTALSKKEMHQLTNILSNDTYPIDSRSAFKEEFVTCGGVSLDSVDSNTLECKTRPRLYFAGEVLDIDGITGGFNFQAAWTTSYTVARAIAKKMKSEQ